MVSRYISDQVLESMAADLLSKYNRLYGEINKPPVPIERIVEDVLDLNILWDAVEEAQGESVLAGLDPEERTIIFNEARREVIASTPGLYSTILAHESGHWEAHVDKPLLQQPPLPDFEKKFECLYRREGLVQTFKEIQAHKFMGYLLIPSSLMYEAINGVDLLSWSNLYRLRETFQVTITSLTVRLQQLNLLYVARNKVLYPSRQEFEGQQKFIT